MVGALLAVVAGMGCGEREPVVVGVAMGGESRAARMAFADAAAAGLSGVDTLFILAANNLAAPALEAAERFVATAGLVALVGHSNSAASITAAQIYNDNAIVQLAPHSTAPLYSQAGPYSFRMVQSDEQQGAFLAEQLRREHPDARVAMVYVNDDYGRGLRSAFLEALEPGDAAPVLDFPHVELPDSAALFRLRAALVEARPDVILWLGRSTVLAMVLPAVHAELGPVPVLGSDGVEGALARPWQEIWRHVRFVALVDMDGGGRLADFSQRFAEQAGRPPTSPEALTYDATTVLLQAIADGARSGEAIRAWLSELGRGRPPFDGITGPVAFDDNGDVARDYVLARIPEPRP
ncbi:MAG: ABC transporter substrate-binding protein [Gemmatimonadota bacterium]